MRDIVKFGASASIAVLFLAVFAFRSDGFEVPQTLASADGPLYVVNIRTDDVLWIRKGPGVEYEKVGALPHDGFCIWPLGRTANGWYKVSYHGITGYASSKYLARDEECGDATADYCDRSRKNYYYVTGVSSDDVLWIRMRPDTGSDKVGALPYDASCVLVLDKKGSWYRVKYHGVTGWSFGKYLDR